MRSFFFPKLAITNIKKNARFYFPYLLTCIATVAMFYVMCMISGNDGIAKMPGSEALSTIMMFGTIVVGIFSVIFLLYTNSFLMKRRKKELGLFNILGMGKRHIARILFNETLITGSATIIIGLIFGVVFSKLIFLVLFKIIRFDVPMGFAFSQSSLIITTILFSSTFLFTLVINLIQIKLANPIELLHGTNIGEREPKSKLLLTIFGLLFLGAGYWIAIVTKSPLEAISLFFVAVVLVILGSYFLFISGSITLLKIIRKNKKYYYQTSHFISVSSMIYRMKQNAVGLASICILSTMVLVMASTTVSLYIGVGDALNTRYPKDISIFLGRPSVGEGEALLTDVQSLLNSKGVEAKNLVDYHYLSFAMQRNGDVFLASSQNNRSGSSESELRFITAGDYQRISGKQLTLNDNEVAIFSTREKLNDKFTIFNNTYSIKEKLTSYPIDGSDSAILINVHYIIVKDEAVLNEINLKQQSAYGEQASNCVYTALFDLSVPESKDKIAIAEEIKALIKKPHSYLYVDAKGVIVKGTNEDSYVYAESKQSNEADFYAIYGGFLFLGLFLGLLFLVATVLIIYYKQISEGYEDKERYVILQKVGMSRNEIKSSIQSQILIVFFLPLTLAIIHIAFAFKMIAKLLALFNLTNVPLFAICTVVTICVFAIIYGIVFALTAKIYYKIVS